MTTPPPRIYNWLDSQLSIARFAGSITINGVTYIVATRRAIGRAAAEIEKETP